jgi:hypothetical protein
MNTPSVRDRQPTSSAPIIDVSRSSGAKSEQLKQQFRAMIEPVVYRARQLGLNRVQIREIITSLL